MLENLVNVSWSNVNFVLKFKFVLKNHALLKIGHPPEKRSSGFL